MSGSLSVWEIHKSPLQPRYVVWFSVLQRRARLTGGESSFAPSLAATIVLHCVPSPPEECLSPSSSTCSLVLCQEMAAHAHSAAPASGSVMSRVSPDASIVCCVVCCVFSLYLLSTRQKQVTSLLGGSFNKGVRCKFLI